MVIFFEGHGFANGKKFIQWKNGCAGYFTPEELSAKGAFQVPEFDVPTLEFPYIPVRDVRPIQFSSNSFGGFGKR